MHKHKGLGPSRDCRLPPKRGASASGTAWARRSRPRPRGATELQLQLCPVSPLGLEAAGASLVVGPTQTNDTKLPHVGYRVCSISKKTY
jgi:hypothetical protein